MVPKAFGIGSSPPDSYRERSVRKAFFVFPYLRIMINWNTPTPPTAPFIASIFNYFLSDHLEGYAEYDEKTLALVKTIPGYLGYESMKHEGRGTFISYWKDMESVQIWAAHPIHIEAKKQGLTWYKYYHSLIAEVERFHSHSIPT
ncbi:MAG: antibiotic biosynthesis monooxygenase [Bacteroidetes bacterium]|nr:antibiotic biosynthesis monooxygenase [Bacteroidota bacterium]